jgi:hypothetical protein
MPANPPQCFTGGGGGGGVFGLHVEGPQQNGSLNAQYIRQRRGWHSWVALQSASSMHAFAPSFASVSVTPLRERWSAADAPVVFVASYQREAWPVARMRRRNPPPIFFDAFHVPLSGRRHGDVTHTIAPFGSTVAV